MQKPHNLDRRSSAQMVRKIGDTHKHNGAQPRVFTDDLGGQEKGTGDGLLLLLLLFAVPLSQEQSSQSASTQWSGCIFFFLPVTFASRVTTFE